MQRRHFILSPLVTGMALFEGVVAAPTPFAAQRRKLSVTEFGASGDGRSNATSAIQAAINRAAQIGGADVIIPAGLFVVSDLRLYGGVWLFGAGRGKTVFRETTGDKYLMSVNPGNAGSVDISRNERDMEIAGIAFEGPVELLKFSEHRHLLNFNGVTGLFIHDCAIRGFRGDGIYLGSSNTAGVERHNIDVRIENNEFDGISGDNRNGISVIDGTRVRINGNRFVRCSRSNMPGPINIEPNGNLFQRVSDIVVADNRFEECGGGAKISFFLPVPAGIQSSSHGVRISKNSVVGNQRGGAGIAIRAMGIKGADRLPGSVFASNVKLVGNVIEQGKTIFIGVDDFAIEQNRFFGNCACLILGSTEIGKNEFVRHGSIARNTFEGQRGRVGALTIGRAEDLVVSQNCFLGSTNGSNEEVAISVAALGSQPLCQEVRLDGNTFADEYHVHVASEANSHDHHILALASNRTLGGRPIVTSGLAAR